MTPLSQLARETAEHCKAPVPNCVRCWGDCFDQPCRCDEAKAVEKHNESIEASILSALEKATAEAADAAKHDAIREVLRMRCRKHLHVPQLNSNEHSGGECGACVQEKATAEARTAEEPIDGDTDASIGRSWRENSSLEKWFPFTAKEIKDLRTQADALAAALEGLMEPDWSDDSTLSPPNIKKARAALAAYRKEKQL